MKLQELAVANPKQQAAKVFESYFGNRVDFNTVSQGQARNMLKRVRGLIAEHRRTPEFHRSERNPSYLKLVMMEQALAAAATTPGAAPAANPDNMAMDMATKKKQAQDQAAAITKQIQELTQQKNQILQQANSPMAEGVNLSGKKECPPMSHVKKMCQDGKSVAEICKMHPDCDQKELKQMVSDCKKKLSEGHRTRRLREASEIQQAQVVLAAQDMVDQVQKMSEQVSAMQFKDLPALVDQIKNEVGVDQATQFNGDASAALSGLLQNLQGAKQQLEAALGVVTGQAPQVPGDEMDVAPGQEEIDIDAEMPAPDGEEDIDAEMDTNVEPAGLGRERR